MDESDHAPANLSSAASVPSSEMCPRNTSETISESSKAERAAKLKTESKTKTLRKRGRPKGKKTASHPLLKRPKRPLSGYNIFFRDKTEEIMDTNSKQKTSLEFAELAKTIGARWKAVDAHTRTMYKSLAAVEMTKYQLDMKEYNRKVKLLDESTTSETNDGDNGSVSNLPSFQEGAGSIDGQVNHQENEIARFYASTPLLGNHDARQMSLVPSNISTGHAEGARTVVRVTSATLGNNDAAHTPLIHDVGSTSHAEDAQNDAQVATANLPPSSTQLNATNEDSSLPITQEVDQLDTNATASEVRFSEIAIPEPNSDESDFTFELIEDILGFDKDESSVPDASFLVFDCKF